MYVLDYTLFFWQYYVCCFLQTHIFYMNNICNVFNILTGVISSESQIPVVHKFYERDI